MDSISKKGKKKLIILVSVIVILVMIFLGSFVVLVVLYFVSSKSSEERRDEIDRRIKEKIGVPKGMKQVTFLHLHYDGVTESVLDAESSPLFVNEQQDDFSSYNHVVKNEEEEQELFFIIEEDFTLDCSIPCTCSYFTSHFSTRRESMKLWVRIAIVVAGLATGYYFVNIGDHVEDTCDKKCVERGYDEGTYEKEEEEDEIVCKDEFNQIPKDILMEKEQEEEKIVPIQ